MYYSLKPRLSILDFLLQLRLGHPAIFSCSPLHYELSQLVHCATVLFVAIPNSILCVCYSIHIFVTNMNVVIRASSFGGECGYTFQGT